MPRYRYVGDTPRTIPALSLQVQPGQELEVAEEISNGDFELIPAKAAKKDAATADSPAPAQEG